MAKQGMKHYYTRHTKDAAPVPELQGKAKSGKETARPLIPGQVAGQVFHTMPPVTFGAVDNDLAIENMEDHFDLTAADLQDFRKQDH